LGREVTGFRLNEKELGLLDESSVSRTSMVRFLVQFGLGENGDLDLVADVLEDLGENHEDFSQGQRQLLFRTVSMLRGIAQRRENQEALDNVFSEAGGLGLGEGRS